MIFYILHAGLRTSDSFWIVTIFFSFMVNLLGNVFISSINRICIFCFFIVVLYGYGCSLPILVISQFKSALFCTICLDGGGGDKGRSCISAGSVIFPLFLFPHHCFISNGIILSLYICFLPRQCLSECPLIFLPTSSPFSIASAVNYQAIFALFCTEY